PLAPPRLEPRYDDGQRIQAAGGADVEWTYHMAPVVLVEGLGGVTHWLVIDPSLSRDRLAGPIPVDAGHQQVRAPAGSVFREQTALGQAPRNPYTGQRYPGNGYLPGVPTVAQADPRRFMLGLLVGRVGRGGDSIALPARSPLFDTGEDKGDR